MIYTYHIENHPLVNTTAGANIFPAVSAEAVLQAYIALAQRLQEYCLSLPLLFVSAKASACASTGIDAWLGTHLDQTSIANIVRSLVSDANKRTPGLNLVISSVSLPQLP